MLSQRSDGSWPCVTTTSPGSRCGEIRAPRGPGRCDFDVRPGRCEDRCKDARMMCCVRHTAGDRRRSTLCAPWIKKS
eukprot:361631-Chlamydomonas_euryale.AAC.4